MLYFCLGCLIWLIGAFVCYTFGVLSMVTDETIIYLKPKDMRGTLLTLSILLWPAAIFPFIIILILNLFDRIDSGVTKNKSFLDKYEDFIEKMFNKENK